ncbi:MAG: hypothetical protein HOP14_15460 [Acidobacteria bacterium]|nr:hypothetical protein [Acidobacteriota bacterium]
MASKPKQLHEPWQSMLVALDRALAQDTELHCMGGFVLAEHYGCVRATADVDVIESLGTDKGSIAQLAGRGSALHKRHRVYVDIVTVADVPDDYDTRLIPMNVDGLTRLRLRAFERHDLVLAKLCRNIDRDREDVVALGRGPGLDIDVLRQRYRDELRPKLGRPDREDLTLQLWIEMIEELRGAV